MKKLEELGISPWPWHTFNDNWIESEDSNPAMSNAAYACNQNDARLIAAAPELYAALSEAVVEWCHDCPSCQEHETYACDEADGKCFVKRWRNVLAEAAGEEVADD